MSVNSVTSSTAATFAAVQPKVTPNTKAPAASSDADHDGDVDKPGQSESSSSKLDTKA